jgi:hypothetical protein
MVGVKGSNEADEFHSALVPILDRIEIKIRQGKIEGRRQFFNWNESCT